MAAWAAGDAAAGAARLPLNFDANAACAVEPAALRAYLAATAGVGVAAADRALGRVAAACGVPAGALQLCAGGTAAAAAACQGALAGQRGGQVLLSALEHPAVARTVEDVCRRQDIALHWLPLHPDGRLDTAALAAALGRPTHLVCLLTASNETGVVQPLAAASALCRAHGVPLYSDATQAVGRLPAAAFVPHCDLMSFSAHKLGGVGGLGVLYVRPPRPLTLPPALRLTDGTAALMALAATRALRRPAATAAAAARRLARLRDELEVFCVARLPDVVVLGARAPRLCNTSCLLLPGCPADGILMALDLAGFAIGAGSACSTGVLAPSPALQAMGLSAAQARSCVRISLPPAPPVAAVQALGVALTRAARRARRLRAAALTWGGP